MACFHQAGAAHGFPSSLLTDNGAVFTAASRNGRCAMETELDRLGIRFVHSSPYHPQTCGKVERFHQTLKRWLAKQEPARTVADLQSLLDRFRAYYNQVRPHRAIGAEPPRRRSMLGRRRARRFPGSRCPATSGCVEARSTSPG